MRAQEVTKLSRKAVSWLVVAASVALSFVGFFYSYYYSWLLSTPSVAEDARQHYAALSRAIGIPSVVLCGVALIAGGWMLFRKR